MSSLKALEDKLRHLQWKKSETDVRIQSILNDSKRMAFEDLTQSFQSHKTEDKTEWVSRVIQEETSKPLLVDQFTAKHLEEDTQRQKERQKEARQRQRALLKRIEQNLKDKEARGKLGGSQSSNASRELATLREIGKEIGLYKPKRRVKQKKTGTPV